MRRFLAILGVGVLCLAVHRGLQFDGWLRPAVITGPSMQPTLWGPSYTTTCPRCTASHRFHSSPSSGTLRCWNCGFRHPAAAAKMLPADHVILDRGAYRWAPLEIELYRQSPRRGDLVAIDNGSSLRVKRVLGIPGDRISVRGDQLRINGRAVRDVLAQPTQAIAVHRQTIHWMPPPDRQAASNEAIDPALDRWRWRDADAGGRPWLVYHHYSLHDRRPDVIRDDYPCNVTSVRSLNPAPHIGMELTLQTRQPATLQIALWTPQASQVYQAVLAAGTHHVRVPPQRWQKAPQEQRTPADRVVRLSATAGVEPIPVDAQHPVAIAGLAAAQPNTVEFTVLRELHWYLRASDRGNWPQDESQLSSGRYFVAGDNQPLSEDSRSAPAGIPFEQIVGRVYAR